MKSSFIALALAAALSGPAFAQQPAAPNADHGAHHPQAPQAQPGAETNPSSPSRMQGMGSGMGHGMMSGSGQGMMSGMGQGMMSCPMMQGGMMRGGMAGMGHGRSGMQMGQTRGDQSVGSIALDAINQRMHRDMTMDYTGDLDADFTRNMIAHHQGAIDMAKIVAAFGKDEKIKELAQGIIKAQEDEIRTMQAWLAQRPNK
jgi:uncharacterized protein (DUF305 family)